MDGLLQFRGLGELTFKLCNEPRHLLLKRLAVVFHLLRPHVPPRREHVAVGSDLGGGGRFAKPRHIFVAAIAVNSPPTVVGAADLLQVGLQQLPVHPIDQRAEFAGIDEQRLPAPIAEAPLGVGSLAPRQEPEAHRDLGL